MIRLDHITITVSNYVASRDWYASNFSLRLEFEDLKAGFGGLEDDGNTELIWVRLLWNDAPGRVEAVLVLFNVKFPVGVEVS